MSAMGKFLRRTRDANRTGVAYFCPGCDEVHVISIGPNEPKWWFDGNIEAPTFSPSVRVSAKYPDGGRVCHHFVRHGQIEFLGDCTHAFRGKTVPLPLWPYAPAEFGGIEDDQ